MRTRSNGQRGAVLAATALALAAFIALTVVAIDLGRLAYTATEVQTVADSAATAGAAAIINGGSPVAEAQSVAAQNHVDGTPAAMAAGDVEIGSYDPSSGSFTPGGAPTNAVRANASATVQNLVANALGDVATTVQKTATAAITGVGGGQPVLPIVIGSCNFEPFQSSTDCADLPSLTQAPNPSDNSGWTSLAADPANATVAKSYLPASCGGGGQPAPEVQVGDFVNVVNGQVTTILQTIKSCFDQGIREFLVPVVPCGQFNQAMEVEGFATIRISNVTTTGNPKGIDLEAICNAEAPRNPGGGLFGTTFVTLVR
jgi:hypothetical protein